MMPSFSERASSLEAETLGKVSYSLSKIEAALAELSAMKERTAEQETVRAYLESSHRLLSGWARESLTGPKDGAAGRLRRFAEICAELDSGRPS
ncbi:MAG TPA: hypothetical protein VLD37_03795 [Candidatus Bilamarchaeum sp.]|nr:hypothetical protein [Candidatus Bilamarchaeum sp.]